MYVEKCWDDLWLGVKSQSNLQISGSPRNSFWTSLAQMRTGGRALFGIGGLPAYPT